MIRRYYFVSGGAILTQYVSNTLVASTATTATFDTVIKGMPGQTVTFKVTTLNHAANTPIYQVDGTPYVLNNTFTKVLSGTGHVTIQQFLDVNGPAGSIILVILTIFSITPPGRINAAHATQQNDKIT